MGFGLRLLQFNISYSRGCDDHVIAGFAVRTAAAGASLLSLCRACVCTRGSRRSTQSQSDSCRRLYTPKSDITMAMGNGKSASVELLKVLSPLGRETRYSLKCQSSCHTRTQLQHESSSVLLAWMENGWGRRSLSMSFGMESTIDGSRIPRLAEFARIKTNSSVS